jgi:RND superfamily putative drug exporter
MALGLSTSGLSRVSARHPWATIGIWAVVLVASFMIVGSLLADALTTEAKVTSTPDSRKGQELLEDRLRGPFKANEAVVISSDSLTVDSPAFQTYVSGIAGEIAGLGPDVIEASTTFYQTNDPNLVSADRQSTIIPIIMAGDIDTATDNIAKVLDIVEQANNRDQFVVHVSGFASVGHDFNEAAERDLARSEVGPLPLALIILVLVFGAVVAALLPIILAVFSIIVAIAITAVIGQQYQFSFFVTNMIVMMGLAVGIDYCLFIISRYREERGKGIEKVEALALAGGTAGRAVLFSGITVVIALLGLLIVPQTIFRSLAGGAILVVLAAVAAAITLLPAVLSLLGDKVNSLRLPFIQHAQESFDEERAGGFWDRVARSVMAHPVVAASTAAILLIAASVPFFDITLGTSGVSTLPDEFQSKQGFLVLEEKFAGGTVNPAEVVIDGDVNSPEVQAAMQRLEAAISNDSVFGPAHFQANSAGDLGLLSIQMAPDPSTDEAVNGIERLRQQYIPQAFSGVDADTFVTGMAAQNLDFYDLTDTYSPYVYVFVLGLSFVLLMIVFRSIVVPAKAIIMNLLSVGAAYGLIVLVFQKGVGASLIGFQQVEAIEAWLPLFLFSILFGLSMDYHVFLLSRIKERYDQTGDNTEAVAFGLRSTGRLITGAALIMVAVFGGFAIGDLVMFQQMGFGLGVAVLIDATVIRSVLVPASMKLLGRWNWYLPPVLNWLPRLGIEGAPASAIGRRPEPVSR